VDDLRWASAVEQTRLLREGLISSSELRAVVVDAIERLDPVVHAVVIPLFEHPGDGVPMLLKDAGQEVAGTPHWVGVAALREVLNTSTATTELAERFETIGFSIVGKGACPPLRRRPRRRRLA
jgi:amidase